MPRAAAIDIGTNSVKITVADLSAGRIENVVVERVEITRLGRGVDKNRQFDPQAAQSTLDALRRFVDEARKLGAETIRAGGTSAMRDASNGDEFRLMAAQITGGEIEVITGDREAQLTFRGAMSDPQVAGQGGRTIVAFDVGGGSTELILGTPHTVERSKSLDLGAVRLTERALHSDPPAEAEMAAARRIADNELAGYEAAEVDRIIGIGGTATTFAQMLAPGRKGLEGMEITAAQMDDLLHRLGEMPLEKRRNTPGLDPARADVILAGMLIIRRILERFGKESYVVSTRGVRYGLLLEMA